ncbi:dicarboxylate/amino acid:cation symporter [Alkalibacterium pelagium]|uniref:Na+/H+-dicarboxylate symporter n=1 Tax=Alkalibacterium pelagium TaxID=426702 RepID=A0A1H7HTC0_9LACT|nr:dicarboxylate/amino acid:cation symporter [Alkalibacterium pelagium]GEN50349.1 dicarboxylate:amino acid:cation symporter DAACS family protein [Alkalibacterium pelagium]SEK53531.1 Na+/H+-dicarboxylate symporter [Alkalibacterium pelagium]
MRKMKLTTKIFIGLLIGVVIGLFLTNNEEIAVMFQPLGDIYIRLISLVMVPLVFTSLLLGVSSVTDIKKVGKIGLSTIVYFMGTTLIAVVIGLVLANVIQPGAGMNLVPEAATSEADFPSLAETIINIFPGNILEAFVEVNMLQIIFIALIFGIGVVRLGEKADPFRNIVQSIYDVSIDVTQIIMEFTPLGVIGLIVPVVATNGLEVLLPLGRVIIAFYLAVIIHIGVTYTLSVKFWSVYNLKEFFKAILPAQLVGFTTCSSSATLPVTLNSMEELKINKEVSGFVLPLGATINMDGAALYQGITALFVAQAYGLELSLVSQLTVIAVGTLASIGAAGVPGAGVIILSMVLSSVGLPLEGVALVAGIDRLLDMGRTMTNITGDATATVIVSNLLNKGKKPERVRGVEAESVN